MLKVSCDSSNEIELERFFCPEVWSTGPEPGFFIMAAGSAHFGGVCEIGDFDNDMRNDFS